MCESVFGLAVARNMDINHLVRACYLAEMVKVVHHVSRNIPIGKWFELMTNTAANDPAIQNFARFCQEITMTGIKYSEGLGEIGDASLPNAGFDQPCVDSLEKFHAFVRKYALIFLRKATILLHVHHGVDFNSYVPTSPEADELSRLTAALRLPTFDEMCAALTPLAADCGWPPRIEVLVHGWIRHQILWPAPVPSDKEDGPWVLPSSALVSHPGIFELVGLPKNFDTLIEYCAHKRCQTTGKDLADPVVCLMCGEIFCGQTICCLRSIVDDGPGDKRKMKIGGAQQHMRFKYVPLSLSKSNRAISYSYGLHKY
jgi:E3 ubiquitin-protein ligase UBR1